MPTLFSYLDSRIVVVIADLAILALAISSIFGRVKDHIDGRDDFSQHTQRQRRKHYLSGMHEPFLPTPDQRAIFQKYFPSHIPLLPQDKETFLQQQTIKTPVHIKPLAACPVELDFQQARRLFVGGPPALMSAVAAVLKAEPITYLCD